MIKSKELEGPSCFTASADDEPLFVLCARDPHAPMIVRLWADRYATAHALQGTLTAEREAKANTAREAADAMDAWRKAHP
jgi:hypothetical protein